MADSVIPQTLQMQVSAATKETWKSDSYGFDAVLSPSDKEYNTFFMMAGDLDELLKEVKICRHSTMNPEHVQVEGKCKAGMAIYNALLGKDATGADAPTAYKYWWLGPDGNTVCPDSGASVSAQQNVRMATYLATAHALSCNTEGQGIKYSSVDADVDFWKDFVIATHKDRDGYLTAETAIDADGNATDGVILADLMRVLLRVDSDQPDSSAGATPGPWADETAKAKVDYFDALAMFRLAQESDAMVGEKDENGNPKRSRLHGDPEQADENGAYATLRFREGDALNLVLAFPAGTAVETEEDCTSAFCIQLRHHKADTFDGKAIFDAEGYSTKTAAILASQHEVSDPTGQHPNNQNIVNGN